jgi:asparagine synthetase B (glutamine-hydrolysing)
MTTAAADAPVLHEHLLTFDDGSWVGLRRDDRGRLCPLTPWPARRGSLHAFFHGRLTNHTDLCRELALPSEGTSDHDVVLHLYARWSDAGLERLRGVFAAGILDDARQEALIARDQVGCHPLFYSHVESGRTLLLATGPRELLRHPAVSEELNRPALADHLCRRWPDREETFFTDVRRVPPGFRLRMSSSAVSAERYWDPVPEDRPVEWITEDVPDVFDRVFNRAVDRCLSFGQAGIFLSGGFDSISIAAVAVDRARQTGRPVPRALSLEFPDPGCNERPTQEVIGRALGMSQRFIRFDDAVGPDRLLTTAMRLNAELGAPVLNAWYPAYLALSLAGHDEGVRTIMTGNGGDEWLGVSPLLSADLIRRGNLVGLARFIRTWQRSYSPERLPLLKGALWTYGLRPIGSMMLHRLAPGPWHRSRLGRAMRRDPTFVAPDPALRAEQRRRLPGEMASPDPPLGFYMQDGRTAIDHTLVSWELEEQYHMGRMANVCFQHPYWDADLIDMLYRTPPLHLNAGGRSKGLVRGAMARRFPELGLERRRKVGAATFYRSILASEGPDLVEAARGFPALTALGVIDPAVAKTELAGLFAEKREMYRAWELVNLESWVGQFVNQGRHEREDKS